MLSTCAGVEILFDLYNATLQKMEVLKLEKRLDEELYYLRDAPQEYSTVPFDFEPVPLPKGATVPLNIIKVGQGISVVRVLEVLSEDPGVRSPWWGRVCPVQPVLPTDLFTQRFVLPTDTCSSCFTHFMFNLL